MSQENRLDWKDKDWATYLGCSIANIPVYKKILDKNFIPVIEREIETGLYSMAVYGYDIGSVEPKILRPIVSGKQQFKDMIYALQDANNIISKMELNDDAAAVLNIPKRAIQMMLMRQK